MPRALEIFRPLPTSQQANAASMAGVPHRNLQKRVLVLLSNAAHLGNVPQPAYSHDEPSEGDDLKQWNALTNWWQQHEKAAVLRDPWLAELAKQKVD